MLPRLVSNSQAQVILLLQQLGCANLISVVTGTKGLEGKNLKEEGWFCLNTSKLSVWKGGAGQDSSRHFMMLWSREAYPHGLLPLPLFFPSPQPAWGQCLHVFRIGHLPLLILFGNAPGTHPEMRFPDLLDVSQCHQVDRDPSLGGRRGLGHCAGFLFYVRCSLPGTSGMIG